MLFSYKYIPHQMEKMQVVVDFIFHEVWCKAPDEEYGIQLYESEQVLHKIMSELSNMDLAGKLNKGAGKFFYNSVNEIFNEFKALTKDEIDEYRRLFIANNKIAESCAGVADVTPVCYSELNPLKISLNEKIEDFFKKLYSSGFFGLQFVVEQIGATLDDYYECFVRENNDGICPFCGLLPIDGEFDPTREAFDHYLPKSKYPFNSVNLMNLAPSCNKCNSGNKLAKDPLFDENNVRRKAFYPFSEAQPDITITVTLEDASWNPQSPEKLSLDITSEKYLAETNTWKDIYRIEQRYVAKCCSNNGGVGWLNRVLDEHQNYNLSRQEMLAAEIQSANTAIRRDSNFLKMAFLAGCDRVGLFSPINVGD